MTSFVCSDLLTNAAELLTCFLTVVAALVSYLFTWRA
jgi:hypothetical protein